MSNELATLETQLNALAPSFTDVLPQGVSAARIIRTVLVSCERLPALLQCNRQSIINAATTAAVLGLEVDGVTGQGYLIPFRVKGQPTAQFIVGYKGYNSMAARSGYTINGAVVREGDLFEYQLGTGGHVQHKPMLGMESTRAILCAWAVAEKPGYSPIISVLSIDELLATKAKSPGAKRRDSPWNDPAIGFPAMCEKTAKRRLARAMPLNVMQMAASMEDQQEIGRTAHVEPDRGVVIEGVVEESSTATEPVDLTRAKTFPVVLSDGSTRTFPAIDQWYAFMTHGIDTIGDDTHRLTDFRDRNAAVITALVEQGIDAAISIQDKLEELLP